MPVDPQLNRALISVERLILRRSDRALIAGRICRGTPKVGDRFDQAVQFPTKTQEDGHQSPDLQNPQNPRRILLFLDSISLDGKALARVVEGQIVEFEVSGYGLHLIKEGRDFILTRALSA